MIKGQIDIKKIEDSKLFESDQGTFLNFVLIETHHSPYENDFTIVENISDVERDAGKKGVVLGNARIVKNGNSYIEGI